MNYGWLKIKLLISYMFKYHSPDIITQIKYKQHVYKVLVNLFLLQILSLVYKVNHASIFSV